MDIERLKELREETEQYRAVADDRCMSTQYEDDILALIDAELASQSVTDEAVQRAISWIESDKIDRQRDWEQQDQEWKSEPGAIEMHEDFLSAFDLAITALHQMRTEPCYNLAAENERLKNTLNSIEFLLQTQNDGADKTSMIRDLMAKHYRQGR